MAPRKFCRQRQEKPQRHEQTDEKADACMVQPEGDDQRVAHGAECLERQSGPDAGSGALAAPRFRNMTLQYFSSRSSKADLSVTRVTEASV